MIRPCQPKFEFCPLKLLYIQCNNFAKRGQDPRSFNSVLTSETRTFVCTYIYIWYLSSLFFGGRPVKWCQKKKKKIWVELGSFNFKKSLARPSALRGREGGEGGLVCCCCCVVCIFIINDISCSQWFMAHLAGFKTLLFWGQIHLLGLNQSIVSP